MNLHPAAEQSESINNQTFRVQKVSGAHGWVVVLWYYGAVPPSPDIHN